MRTAGFFRSLPAPVKAALPARLKEVSHRVRSSQAQWFYDDPRLHFEAWWHRNTGRLELGLHLEAAPALNERIAAGLARQLLMIKARLGSGSISNPGTVAGFASTRRTRWRCSTRLGSS